MTDLIIELAYGNTTKQFVMNDENLLGIYHLKDVAETPDETQVLKDALENPIGTSKLREIVKPGQKIAIVTSDLTRPCPSARILPFIVEELEQAGVRDEDVTIIIALGLHREMTDAEIGQVIPAEYRQRFTVLNHDVNDVVHLGETSKGTPVELFRPVVEADVRICLGNVEFHYFAGYSGGAKAIFPGCASKAAITANHSMMTRPEVRPGVWEGNPVRADFEEAVGILGVDFIFNVIVNEHHQIVGAVAGDMIQAHRIGCEMVAERGKVSVPAQADLVIASAGGFPKDIDLYQAQKALENASQFVREGGIVILVGKCAEGFGNQTFEEWFLDAESPQAILQRIQQEFVLGGHKAAAFANVQLRQDVYLISDIPQDVIRRTGLIPYDDLQKAFDDAMSKLGKDTSVIVLPQAGSILPKFE
ncbi:MAG TPA: nickel-dependent lactate racemase [Anaerolineae bacterium]|nr:nickel-dependent lactate racemase [Anaerolineae bacterium]